MSSLSLFDFNGNSVRSFLIGETIWFLAKDVCDVLELENVGQALARLDEDEKGVILNDTLGGTQEMATISEQGFYSLVLSSRKPQAKPFRKWVTSEVLPAIRRTGTYSLSIAQQPQRQLAPQRDLKDWIECAQVMSLENDPIIKSLITQRLAEELGGETAEVAAKPIVLTVRAQQLGISQKEIGTGAKLGKYIVGSGFEPMGKSQHGKYEVNVYRPSDELDEAILSFFA